MDIKIRGLETFVTVADCGNLADAAARLHRTPSAVSMALKQLEAHFGRRLFEADRKAQLTPLGRYVLQQARRELEHFGHTVRSMERFAWSESGSVRVACVPSVAMRLMPVVLARFRERHAGVEVDLRDMDSESVCEALRQGEVDLGLASAVGRAEGFVSRPLARDPFGVVCAARHPLARRRGPLRWRDLAAREFIANGTCRHIDDPELSRLLGASTLTVRNTTSLVALVAAGVGVTVLPRLAVEAGGRNIRFRPLAAPVPVRELVVLRRGGVTPTPAVEALEESLIAAAGRLATCP